MVLCRNLMFILVTLPLIRQRLGTISIHLSKKLDHVSTKSSHPKHIKLKSLSWSTPIYPKLTSALLEAATWSGKTSTMWFIIQDLWETKNKLNTRLSPEKSFPNLNILVLNDRIGLVEQLRDELVHWSINTSDQTIKQPILSQELINQLSIKTYHSKADNDPESDYRYTGTQSLEIDLE